MKCLSRPGVNCAEFQTNTTETQGSTTEKKCTTATSSRTEIDNGPTSQSLRLVFVKAFEEVASGWVVLAEQMQWMEHRDEAKEGDASPTPATSPGVQAFPTWSTHNKT
jgi:hypothetical protein